MWSVLLAHRDHGVMNRTLLLRPLNGMHSVSDW